MTFWDSSAVVPLLVWESSTDGALDLLKDDPVMLVWWGTEVECASALARLERDGALETAQAATAFARLRDLSSVWHEVEPSDLVRDNALRFLRVHSLRAADALQLAAAFVASDRRPPSLTVATLDDRLAEAARREGFTLVHIDP